jgi:hypothetical protein
MRREAGCHQTRQMIEADSVAKYVISFVKVRMVQGDVQYLVTTRQVKKD